MKHKKIVIATATAILLISLLLLFWFKEPISVSSKLKNVKLFHTSISYVIKTPGVGSTSETIETNDSGKMQTVVSIMDQYPCSRKLFESSFGSNFKVANSIEVSLSYQTQDKKEGMFTYLIDSDGQIQISDWGKQYQSYETEWFSNNKGKEYYQKMKEFFDRKKSNKDWKQR